MKLLRVLLFVLAIALVVVFTPLAAAPQAMAFTARHLVYGSRGDDVYELQSRLRLLGYYWGRVDGLFGWKTYWAVRTFQYNFGMKVDGVVGPKTKRMLVKATPNWHWRRSGGSRSASNHALPSRVQGLSASDIRLMQHVVYGEARGEPFEGQVAVAAVILNRLHSPKFPHSIPAIIYQPGAFDAVSDGQINLPPDETSLQAVLDAIHGWDPTHGALYYFNPAKATSRWIWSRPQIARIGSHIFTL
ncbi:spore cortex-lytic enzyme [Alicyclobacillus cellulosilyticus]|uniref:Spore cortex-lytic enzyme n=1 Tax=Alicyclobacillus cellulosilyticus TaxID=1003997 RepID=A0A917KDT6_9BACL|nr:spore cortex-lytic enzyme [Alicyclobacillus cellulosilyticus]GGJ10306.1 spore cortex-lytic enzyme [Alicyclobacillus cellulosilyticus]